MFEDSFTGAQPCPLRYRYPWFIWHHHRMILWLQETIWLEPRIFPPQIFLKKFANFCFRQFWNLGFISGKPNFHILCPTSFQILWILLPNHLLSLYITIHFCSHHCSCSHYCWSHLYTRTHTHTPCTCYSSEVSKMQNMATFYLGQLAGVLLLLE